MGERLRLFPRVRADKIIDTTAEALFSRLFAGKIKGKMIGISRNEMAIRADI